MHFAILSSGDDCFCDFLGIFFLTKCLEDLNQLILRTVVHDIRGCLITLSVVPHVQRLLFTHVAESFLARDVELTEAKINQTDIVFGFHAESFVDKHSRRINLVRTCKVIMR